MLGMVPADAMAEVTEAAETPEVPDAPAEEAPSEEPEQPEVAPEETPAEEPEVPAEPAAPGEELPEGVSRETKGLRVEESRWKTIYGNHQLVQQGSELIGEPLTKDALELRNNAYLMQEQMYSDLNSADSKLQGQVLDFVLGDMARAQRDGEVGSDPAVPFTQAFYERIQQHPDAYAQLRFSAAKDLVGEMFTQAAQTNDTALFNAAQHISRVLAGIKPELLKTPNGIATLRDTTQRMGLPFYLQEEMAGLSRGADPMAQLRAENERLQAQLNGRQVSTQTAQFDTWRTSTNQAIATGILNDAITPALASVADSWKGFPKEYQEQIVTPLQGEVNRVLGEDVAFKERIRQLGSEAQRAVSPQVRERYSQQIKQLYTNRASQIIEAQKRPIIAKAAEWLKGRSAANHARRQAGQSQTAPRGVATAVPRSVIPDNVDRSVFTGSDGLFDPMKAAKYLGSILPR